jgi:hypothetical protein
MVARGWTEAQKRAYLIADNKLTENGGWDDALLRIELGDLAEMGFAELTGFNEAELREMGIGVEGLGAMPPLADGERSPFQQMTFILHASQSFGHFAPRAPNAHKPVGIKTSPPRRPARRGPALRSRRALVAPPRGGWFGRRGPAPGGSQGTNSAAHTHLSFAMAAGFDA